MGKKLALSNTWYTNTRIFTPRMVLREAIDVFIKKREFVWDFCYQTLLHTIQFKNIARKSFWKWKREYCGEKLWKYLFCEFFVLWMKTSFLFEQLLSFEEKKFFYTINTNFEPFLQNVYYREYWSVMKKKNEWSGKTTRNDIKFNLMLNLLQLWNYLHW